MQKVIGQMASVELFEQLEFKENPLYEKIIAGLLEDQYCVAEDFFDQEEVNTLRNHLLQKYEEDNFKKAAIGNRLNETIERSVRGDFILWINEKDENEVERVFFSKINSLVEYLNKTCFLGILQKEFHYAVYPEGTFYKRHLDTFQNDDRRKFSLVCYLNNEDWMPENGGELVIYKETDGIEKEINIYPFPGRIVVFESQILEHEVKPVKIPRLSITGWLKTR